mgnify:CR=1 FL=1
MEFYEVIDRRKTSREWTDKEVDFQAIKRILTAGMKAPSWDHYRNWQFIVLHTREEKENAQKEKLLKFIKPDKHTNSESDDDNKDDKE